MTTKQKVIFREDLGKRYGIEAPSEPTTRERERSGLYPKRRWFGRRKGWLEAEFDLHETELMRQSVADATKLRKGSRRRANA